MPLPICTTVPLPEMMSATTSPESVRSKASVAPVATLAPLPPSTPVEPLLPTLSVPEETVVAPE